MNKFSIIVGASAFFVATMAAIFSVTGVSLLFSGSMISVGFMMASLEVGKLVTASFLYQHWKKINILMKVYMTIGIVILVGITSSGIFGYLSNAYMGASVEFEGVSVKLDFYENEIKRLEDDKFRYIKERDDQISLLPDNYITRKRQMLDSYRPLIEDINSQLNETYSKIGPLKSSLIETGIDVGPFIWISKAFNTDIDTAVKWFIFILIFVFDPLAVLLIIATNITLVGIDKPAPKKVVDKVKESISNPISSIIKKIKVDKKSTIKRPDKPGVSEYPAGRK